MRQTTRRRRALALLNPGASRGDATERAIALLQSTGFELLTPALDGADAIARAIREHRDVDVVIAGGGDGTVRAAADALVETALPLAILPMGTANDFARGLGIPAELAAACELAAAGPVRAVDAALCDGKWFVNDASVGLAVEAVQSAGAASKRRWGRLGYVAGIGRALRRLEPFQIRISCDGRRYEQEALQIVVASGRYYGGGLVVSPHARPDDGALHVCVIHSAPWWRLAALIPSLRLGRLPTGGMTVLRGARVELGTDQPMPVTTDGDVTAETPVTLVIKPGALQVIAPGEMG